MFPGGRRCHNKIRVGIRGTANRDRSHRGIFQKILRIFGNNARAQRPRPLFLFRAQLYVCDALKFRLRNKTRDIFNMNLPDTPGADNTDFQNASQDYAPLMVIIAVLREIVNRGIREWGT
jgi:hypothetical protein